MFSILISTFLLWTTVESAFSSADYCSFDEKLLTKLNQIPCSSDDWNQCATEIRKTIQNSTSGAWGVVVVGDKDDIINGKIDWHIHIRHSQKCRLLLNHKIFVDIFQTGLHSKNIETDQENWKIKNGSSLMETCPHSSLRQILSRFWIQKPSHAQFFRRRRNNPNTAAAAEARIVHTAAKTLSQLFFDETSHKWNIFIAKNSENLGINLPHYHFEARPGFCIGKSRDGYTILAALIEYIDNDFSELFLF